MEVGEGGGDEDEGEVVLGEYVGLKLLKPLVEGELSDFVVIEGPFFYYLDGIGKFDGWDEIFSEGVFGDAGELVA